MLIDTHCQLQFSVYDIDRENVIRRAKNAGVEKIIIPGVDLPSSKKGQQLSRLYPNYLYYAVGIHPHASKNIQDINTVIRCMKDLINPDTIAIGECGLDYFQYKNHKAEGKKYEQKNLFASQLEIALKTDKPVIIHCRNAYGDLFEVLDSMPTIPRGVLHCFSGGLQDVRLAIDRNLYIGIDGNVTYSKNLTNILPYIPLDNLLLETDAPYLTPVPNRGKRNEPAFIRFTALYIADKLSLNYLDLLEITGNNAKKLFKITS